MNGNINTLRFKVAKAESETALQYQEVRNQTKRADENFKETQQLSSDSRYKKGYGDGYEAAVCAMNGKLKELPWRG
jgi:hypothetical protein